MSSSMKIGLIFMPLMAAVAMSHKIRRDALSYEDELSAGVVDRANHEIDFDQTLQRFNLTSLRTLLIQTKLFKSLNDTSNSHTVFAPTNEAIRKAASVLKNATRLPEILKFHVHFGPLLTDKFSKDMRVKTLLGGQKKIRIEIYRGIFYGSCQPLGAVKDRTYDNGVLDILDGVMIPPEGTLFDLVSTSTFSTFLKLVNRDRFQETLRKQSPMTLLAPNNAAFAKLPPDVMEKLNTDYRFLHKVLRYHVVTEILCAAGLENGNIPTLEGKGINVRVSGGKVLFNNSTLIKADVMAYNGLMHVINAVLLPPALFD